MADYQKFIEMIDKLSSHAAKKKFILALVEKAGNEAYSEARTYSKKSKFYKTKKELDEQLKEAKLGKRAEEILDIMKYLHLPEGYECHSARKSNPEVAHEIEQETIKEHREKYKDLLSKNLIEECYDWYASTFERTEEEQRTLKAAGIDAKSKKYSRRIASHDFEEAAGIFEIAGLEDKAMSLYNTAVNSYLENGHAFWGMDSLEKTGCLKPIYWQELNSCAESIKKDPTNFEGWLDDEAGYSTIDNLIEAAQRLDLSHTQRKPLRQLVWNMYRSCKRKKDDSKFAYSEQAQHLADELGIYGRFFRIKEAKGDFKGALKLAKKLNLEEKIKLYSNLV